MCKAIRVKVEELYQYRLRTGETKKLSMSELLVLMAKVLDAAWKQLCKGNMMQSAFSDVEDSRMKFQGQPKHQRLHDHELKERFECLQAELLNSAIMSDEWAQTNQETKTKTLSEPTKLT